MKKSILLISILISTFTASAYSADCIDWGRLMVRHEIADMPASKRSVALESFDDFTKAPGDDWLSVGIPELLTSFLSTGEDINVLYGPTAKYHPSAVNPKYAITGMFQHLEGRLRIFIKLMEGGALVEQYQLDVAYPQNKQFVNAIGDSAWQILGVTSPHYDKKTFDSIRKNTLVIPAYENYIRGRIAYRSFDPYKMDVAKTWFEEAKKADVSYVPAYLGLADVYIFQAMYNKQNRKAFSQYFEMAERELNSIGKASKQIVPPNYFRRYIIKERDEPNKITNRHLLSNASFTVALHMADGKQWMEAARYFEEALNFVPEDAITWYHLSSARERTGDKRKAREALAKALEINKCLQ